VGKAAASVFKYGKWCGFDRDAGQDARPVPLFVGACVVAVWAPLRGVHQPWLGQVEARG